MMGVQFKGLGSSRVIIDTNRNGNLWLGIRDGDDYVYSMFPKETAPAIAAAVLEAAGVEEPGFYCSFDAHLDAPTEKDRLHMASSALWSLKRAAAAREYHAKPRVTDEQVSAVMAELSRRGGGYRRDEIRDNLQAALDSGVFQVPADPTNKEGDRGE